MSAVISFLIAADAKSLAEAAVGRAIVWLLGEASVNSFPVWEGGEGVPSVNQYHQ
jgi:hypothetical protein